MMLLVTSVFALGLVATPGLASHGPTTITLNSGGAPLGAADPIVDMSVDGITYRDAIVYQHPFNHLVPGTKWVSVNSAGSPYGPLVRFRVTFELPVGFGGASLSTTLHCDDWVEIYLNGTRIGGQSPSSGMANFLNPPEVFSTSAAALFREGTNVLEYHANNGGDPGGVDFSTRITYTPNHGPVAADDTYSLDEDSALEVAAPGVLGNDADEDGDPITAEIVTTPAEGSIELRQDGSFLYVPSPNSNGADAFDYRVTDGIEVSIGHVSMTILPVNDAPFAVDDGAMSEQYGSVVIDVVANDADVDGDAVFVDSVGVPAAGTAVANPDGTITYDASPSFRGTDAFTYRIADGAGGSDEALVTVSEISCGEDGIDPLVGTPAEGSVSGTIDGTIEPLAAEVGGEDTARRVHEANCSIVVTVENAIGGSP